MAARTRSSVALLFVDVDGLKRVNDELGHVVGDLLLKETADVIRETIRASDIAGRLGGDEFCVLLMGDPELDPERVVERMQDTLSVHNARSGRTYHVSLVDGDLGAPAGPIGHPRGADRRRGRADVRGQAGPAVRLTDRLVHLTPDPRSRTFGSFRGGYRTPDMRVLHAQVGCPAGRYPELGKAIT